MLLCNLRCSAGRRRGGSMAIYHFTVSIISRGKGKSAVASAAYCAAEKIVNDYDGITHDYTKKQGVIYSEIMLPDNVPEEFKNRNYLWNSVELSEKNCNAQLARQVEFALPKEFSKKEQIDLTRNYIKTNFVSKGMIADFSIHDKEDGNPHAHIMLTMREVNSEGKWMAKSYKEYILDKSGQKIKTVNGNYKCRKVERNDWNNRDNVTMWRLKWADAVNEKFKEVGIDVTPVDHRSYKEQKKIFLPTRHLGCYSSKKERFGYQTKRGNYNREVAIQNKKRKEKIELIKHHKVKSSIFMTTRDIYCCAARPQITNGYLDNSIIGQKIQSLGKFNLVQIAQIISANSPIPITMRQAVVLLNRNIKSHTGGIRANLKLDLENDIKYDYKDR